MKYHYIPNMRLVRQQSAKLLAAAKRKEIHGVTDLLRDVRLASLIVRNPKKK